MEIKTININEIKKYENNVKEHPEWQIEQIKKSITEFGNNDPIAIDENNIIIAGHGRFMALKDLGFEEIPVIQLTHLSEEQKKAYVLVHNKLTMNTGFDFELLEKELNNIVNIDMSAFDFDIKEQIDLENPYTDKVATPNYEITGEKPKIEELVDSQKTDELIKNIENLEVDDETKEFLKMSAQRHLKFDYGKIAEFYAHSNSDVQEAMEQSALVIIDFDKAIENGFVEINDVVSEMIENEE